MPQVPLSVYFFLSLNDATIVCACVQCTSRGRTSVIILPSNANRCGFIIERRIEEEAGTRFIAKRRRGCTTEDVCVDFTTCFWDTLQEGGWMLMRGLRQAHTCTDTCMHNCCQSLAIGLRWPQRVVVGQFFPVQ